MRNKHELKKKNGCDVIMAVMYNEKCNLPCRVVVRFSLIHLCDFRLVHYHNALRRMLGSSEVRGKAGKNEKFALRTGVIIIELMGLFFQFPRDSKLLG
jgi:hypothetical protein